MTTGGVDSWWYDFDHQEVRNLGRVTVGEDTSQFSVVLPAEVAEALDRVRQRRLTSRAQVVREAVVDWLRRQGELDAEPEVAAAV